MHRHAEPLQGLRHALGGALLLVLQFGVGVQVAPEGDQCVAVPGDSVVQVHERGRERRGAGEG